MSPAKILDYIVVHELAHLIFSDHGANRLGASALMQGLADGYFVIPYTLANYPGEEALAEAKRDQDFVGNTGALEDLAVVSSIQKSIGSGANDVFTFGKFESCIVHFHRGLDAALNTPSSPRL